MVTVGRYVHACVSGGGWMGEMGFARAGSMNNYVRLLKILCLYFVVDGGDGAAVGHNKTRKKKNDKNRNQLTSSKMKRLSRSTKALTKANLTAENYFSFVEILPTFCALDTCIVQNSNCITRQSTCLKVSIIPVAQHHQKSICQQVCLVRCSHESVPPCLE